MAKRYNVGFDASYTMSPLPDEELLRLIEESQRGNRDAEDVIARSYANLIRSQVFRRARDENDLEDLFSIGCIALIKAIRKFNVSYGASFVTYAKLIMLRSFIKYYQSYQLIGVPRCLQEKAFEIKKGREKLEKELNGEPSLEEISEYLGMPEKEIEEVTLAVVPPISIYTPISDEDDSCMIDFISIYDEHEIEESLCLNEAINALNDEERKIIYHRYVLEQSQEKVGEILKCSQMTISRKEKSTRKKMKYYLK